MKKSAMLTLYVVFVFGLLTSSTSFSSSPNVNKGKIVSEVKWGDEPVAIIDLRVYDKPIVFDSSFPPTDDAWMRGLSFKVKNTSKKSLTYLRFELQFPLRDSPRPTYYVEAIEYGKAVTPNLERAVGPGETVQLTCDSVDIEMLKRVTKEKGEGDYVRMNRVLISLEIVTFEDKTSWAAGQLLRFDEVSKKWREISQTQKEQVAVHFTPVSLAPKPPNDCYKPYIDTLNCTGDCDSGGSPHVSIPGELNGSNSEVDKNYRCNASCVIAYTGVKPGCTH